MERALPQEVLTLLYVPRVVFISELGLAVLTIKVLVVQHVNSDFARFPVNVGVAAVRAILLLLYPLVYALAAVKFLAI
jgi:hypothetical protein